MSELAGIQSEVHALGTQIAGLQPMVQEVHGQMPKIAEALEILAGVSAKLENNSEDHKRIHHRITGLENVIKSEVVAREDLETRFVTLKDEHIVCVTTGKVERRIESSSWWTKAKAKAMDKTVEIITLAIIGFTAWMVLSHLSSYPRAAQYMTTNPSHAVTR